MRFVSVGLGLGFSFALGCGLRSDPLFVADTDGPDGSSSSSGTAGSSDAGSSDDSEDFPPPVEGRAGSCTNPIELPTTDSSVSGELRGPGLYTTECDPADGLEDVYAFTPPAATDVTITFDPAQTDFSPIVRITEFGCGTESVVLRACTDDWLVGGAADPRHFVAAGNRTYYIAVDSSGGGGNYGFDVSLGPVPLEECELHPETIVQEVGSRFLWANDLSQGQGVADSFCGGIGREDVFRLEQIVPGPVRISAFATGAFRPVLSVRTACSSLTELECTSDQILGTPGFGYLEVFLDPGTYYISVDSLVLDAGGYELEVEF